MEPSHRRLVRAVTERAWALRPDKLAAILDFVQLRVDGHKFSDQEIRERIGATRAAKPAAVTAGSVAVIPISGVIAPKANLMQDISGGTSLEQFSTLFQEALDDRAVSAILLNVDSPGGAVDLVPETAALIRSARKPVTAVANTTAASAALWLAVQADEFVVTPSGEAGSIGVFAAHDDISAMQEAMGVKTTLISAGEFKTEGNPFESLSEEARAAMQDTVDQFYGMFVSDVAKGRGVSVADVGRFGNGRMLTAKDAVSAGLADRVETFDQTLARMTGGKASSMRARRAEVHVNEVDLSEHVYSIQVAPTLHANTNTTASSSNFQATIPSVSVALPKQDQAVERPEPEAHHEPASRATADSMTTRKEHHAMFSSIEELVARQDEIRTRQQEIDAEHAGQQLPDDVRGEFDTLEEEWETITKTVTDLRDRKERLAAKVKAQKVESGTSKAPHTSVGRKTPDNIWALEEYRVRAHSLDELGPLYRDGARRALEIATIPHPDADHDKVKSHVERLLAKDTDDGQIARRVLATGSPSYERGFAKKLVGVSLNATELRALEIGSGAGGNYAVPVFLDPTVIPTSNGAVNPLRAISRTETITGNVWKGVSSDGITASYDAEHAEVSDDSPTLAQPAINVEKAQAFIKFSIEIGEDWSGMLGEMSVLLQDAKDTLEANKFTLGAGHSSTEPQGVVAGLPSGSKVDTATTATFVIDDLYTLENALPPRFRPLAQAVANRAFYNKIRSLSGDQFDVFVRIQQGLQNNRIGNTGAQLLGYPANEASDMSTAVSTTAALILLLGDFRYYCIVDRVGMNVEIVPHLMGTSGRPTGDRGLYAYWRNSAGILSNSAFRVLKVK